MDRLLTVAEAAERLSTSEDWLYRVWKRLPFAVKLSRKQLRFSEQGIDDFIKGPNNGGSGGMKSFNKEDNNAGESVPTR